MAVKNKAALVKGVLLSLSFFVILVLIFMPIFGEGRNGLVFSDDMFNKLSKGSSFFIPQVRENVSPFQGTSIEVSIKLEQPKPALTVLRKAGASVAEAQGMITIKGDLGKLMIRALDDAESMFFNDGNKVKARYGMDEKEVLVAWWNVMKVADKTLKKQKLIDESNIVSMVQKKAIEPAYNFYGIESQRVLDKAGLMTGLLVFYVVYTMWWGFAIFYLFEALGLTMKKAKIKKEV